MGERSGGGEKLNRATYRFRPAASLARPGWIWAAAIATNAPAIAAAALLGWFTYSADEAALEAVAGVLFAVTLLWAVLVTLESWQVLRRFSRRTAANRMRAP